MMTYLFCTTAGRDHLFFIEIVQFHNRVGIQSLLCWEIITAGAARGPFVVSKNTDNQACWFVGMRLLTTISYLGGLTAESYRYVLFVKLFPVCLFKALISVKSSCSPLRHILWGQHPRVCKHMHLLAFTIHILYTVVYIVRTQTNIPIYWLCCLYAVVYSIYSFCYFVCLLSLVCSASTASSEFHNLILKNLIFALKFSYVYQCLFRKWKPKFT